MDLEALNGILIRVWNHEITVEEAAQDIADALHEAEISKAESL